MIEIRHVPGGETRAAYDELYRSRSLQHPDGYYRWLVGLLHPQPGHRLLDIACGEGVLLNWARRAGLEAWGLDLSSEAIAVAREQAPGVHLLVGNGEHLPFPAGFFEYITSIGSLEHYENPQQGMREIARLLSLSGRACILLPNTFGLLWNINYVRRTGDICDDGQPIQRYATRMQWQRMLECNGLQVTQVLPYDRAFPVSRRDWLWFLRRPHKFLSTLLVRALMPVNLASCLVFLCRPGASGTETLAETLE